MTRPSPAAALNKTRSGNMFDRCNRRIRTGDKAIAYSTYYENDSEIIHQRFVLTVYWSSIP